MSKQDKYVKNNIKEVLQHLLKNAAMLTENCKFHAQINIQEKKLMEICTKNGEVRISYTIEKRLLQSHWL